MAISVMGLLAPEAFAKKAATAASVGGAVAPEGGVAPEIETTPEIQAGVPTAPTTELPETTAPQTPVKHARHAKRAPVTSHSTKLTYKGPVYEKAADGQLVPYGSSASTVESETDAETTTGGIAVGASVELDTPESPELLVPGHTARVVEGLAAAPMEAPESVQDMIWAANQIIGLPYVYGGGHNASFTSSGYDCSGTVSFALHGADLLKAPEDSSEFMEFGKAGVGQWVTIFSNPGHAYMTVAGLRLDTSSADDPSDQQGPRWRPLRPSNAGYRVRHPTNL